MIQLNEYAIIDRNRIGDIKEEIITIRLHHRIECLETLQFLAETTYKRYTFLQNLANVIVYTF